MAVAILTLLGGVLMFFIGRAAVEEEIAKVEQQIAQFTPEEHVAFEANMQQDSGMSWAQATASDRGRVRLLLATNIGLSALYLGLWFWAKKNALGAALVAFIVYVTVIVASAIFDPTTIVQGIIIKIVIVGALLSAVSSAYKFRRLEGTEP